MRLRPEAKVGLVVFLAFIAFASVYYFLGGSIFQAGHYTISAVFDDVLRLSRKADVRMAGVRIGSVESISLYGKKARVELEIMDKYRGAIPDDSTARITTGGLVGVGEYLVEIMPGSSRTPVKPGGSIKTVKQPNLDDVMNQVTDIVSGIRTSVQSVNEVLQDPETRQALREVITNVRIATERTALLTDDIRSLVRATGPQIDQLLATVQQAADDFAAVNSDIRIALEAGGIQQVQKALVSAGRAAENLEAASVRLREFTEDETVTADLKHTVASAREAAEGAAQIVEKLQRTLGIRRDGTQNGQQPEKSRVGYVPGTGARFDAFALNGGDFRTDFNYTLPGVGRNDYYRIGIFDLGESSKLNLQYGRSLDDRSALRYGLYASRLGIGYDRLIDNDLGLHLDLYRPNDPKLEAKLRYDFSPNFGAWVGTEDLFGNNGALFGLQYRR